MSDASPVLAGQNTRYCNRDEGIALELHIKEADDTDSTLEPIKTKFDDVQIISAL